MKALVECCADGSAEVRFWSVFALGAFVRSRRRRKTPLIVVRALEARLGDLEYPDIIGYWPVGLEALAMLQGCRQTRYPIKALFRETILKVMREPLITLRSGVGPILIGETRSPGRSNKAKNFKLLPLIK